MIRLKPLPLRGMRLETVVRERFRELEKTREIKSDSSGIPRDINEFAKRITIRSGNKLVPFQLYEHQKVMLELIENHRGVVGVKSRQMGATQAVTLRFLHKACLNPAYSALVFSKSQQDTSLIAYRCREMVKSLDGLIELISDNLQTIRIAGGGTIYFRNSKVDGARGIDSVSDILYDEAAFVPEVEEIYGATDATQSMVGEDARTIILSTPNGASGWYFDRVSENNPEKWDLLTTCEKVRTGEYDPIQYWTDSDGWVKFIAHWKAHPIYSQDENYLETIAKARKMPESQVKQEYDLSFEDSIEKVFSHVMNIFRGKWTRGRKEDCEYYMGVDSQFGGADYFVAVVIEHNLERNTFRLVDMYRDNYQRRKNHLKRTVNLVREYNPERIAVEKNTGGQIYVEDLEDACPNNVIVPITSTNDSKEQMLSRLLYILEEEQMLIPNDKKIKNEFRSFARIDGRLEGAEGEHDDIPMAIMISSNVLPIVEEKTPMDPRKVRTR